MSFITALDTNTSPPACKVFTSASFPLLILLKNQLQPRHLTVDKKFLIITEGLQLLQGIEHKFGLGELGTIGSITFILSPFKGSKDHQEQVEVSFRAKVS